MLVLCNRNRKQKEKKRKIEKCSKHIYRRALLCKIRKNNNTNHNKFLLECRNGLAKIKKAILHVLKIVLAKDNFEPESNDDCVRGNNILLEIKTF